MKTALVILLWIASLFCAYRAGHIISNRFDYGPPAQVKAITGGWSAAQVSTNDWLRNARFRQFGKFLLMRPRNPKQAGLLVGVIGMPRGPVILVSEAPNSERPEGFSLYDAAGNMITAQDKNDDGVFEILALQTTNGAFLDKGLTGTFKLSRDLHK